VSVKACVAFRPEKSVTFAVKGKTPATGRHSRNAATRGLQLDSGRESSTYQVPPVGRNAPGRSERPA